MLKLISIILIICIVIFLIVYKIENLIKKLKSRTISSNKRIAKINKTQIKQNKYNQFSQDFNDIDNFSNFNKAILRREMLHLFKGSKEEKIKSLRIAEFLSDKSTLTILKLALKDMDSDIIKVSAKLIQKFK